MPERSNAVAFARVSTGRQGEGFSLPMQEKLIVAYAEKKGLVLDPKRFILTESGWKKERKGFKEMLAFVQANHIPNLLTLNEERLCRDVPAGRRRARAQAPEVRVGRGRG